MTDSQQEANRRETVTDYQMEWLGVTVSEWLGSQNSFILILGHDLLQYHNCL